MSGLNTVQSQVQRSQPYGDLSRDLTTVPPTPQPVEGQDGGRSVSVSSLIKKFDKEKTTGSEKLKGPPSRKPPEPPTTRGRGVTQTQAPKLSEVVTTSKGPLTGPKTTPVPTPPKSEHEVRIEKFGSKTANLYKIADLGVKVPELAPVSSKEVFDHLMKKDTDGVIKKGWEAMQELGDVDPIHLKAITDKIEEIFDEGYPFTTEQRTWIEETMAGKVLIARSTGDEDSADTPNAGGNESVLFVEPNTASVNKAMKEVVLSYFGADSLRNRIVGDGMEKVLSGLPKMPVLLMEMVAEPIKDPSKVDPGSPPPVGIAMSTDKVEFTGGEDFHFVSISSAVGPGVNEGSGRIEIDETFVMQAKDGTPLLIYQKPSVKEERIRAVKDGEKITHQLVKNSKEQAYSPSLSRDQVRSLVTSTDKIKGLNNGATTEVEGVVGGDKQINFVQHRPIPDSLSKVEPTYVSTSQSNGHSKVFNYTTVVPKSGDALVIDDWSQVCFAETMKEAEALFDWTGGTQKLVIVRQPDCSNSHPAVNFGSFKKTGESGKKEPNPIPCLVVPNYGELLAMKKDALSSTQPLVIDGQTQKAFVWTDGTFDKSTAIIDGRISHHIGLETGATGKGVPELVAKLKTATSEEFATLKGEMDPILESYANKIKDLETLLTKNADTIHNSEGLTIQLKTTKENFEAVKEAFAQFLAGNPKYDAVKDGTHARLLMVKFLESSLHDVEHFPQLIEAGKSATRYLQAMKGSPVDKPVFADQVNAVKEGLTGPLNMRWKRFLALAEQSGLSQKEIADFKNMMADLDKMGVTANWMSTVFDKKYAELLPPRDVTGKKSVVPKAKELLQALVKDYQSTAPFLAKHQNFQKKLEDAERSVADFATSSKYEKAFSNLKGLAKSFIDEPWPQDLNSNALKKAVQIETLGRLIEVYDTSIKTLKNSDMPTDKLLKAELEMLDTFSELFASVFTKADLPSGNPNPKSGYVDQLNKEFTKIKDQVSKLDPTLDKVKMGEQFRCGKNFNVTPCLYNNRAKVVPSNVEEMFTTLHQGLEDIRAGLMVSGESNYNIDMPKEMHALLSMIPELAVGTRIGKPPVLVGREITSTGVTYTYNLIVNDHGVKVKANYEKPTTEHSKGRTTIEIDFYADNTGDRLEKMATVAKQFSFGAESLDDPSRRQVTWGQNQCTAKFEVRSEKDLKKLSVYMTGLVRLSISTLGAQLTKIAELNSNLASGDIDKRRQRMLNDFLNIALGTVTDKAPKGSDIIPTRDFNIQFGYSKAFTFDDSGMTHTLDLGKPDFGLTPLIFAKIPPDTLSKANQAVLEGPSKFTFDHNGKTYSVDTAEGDFGLSQTDIEELGLKQKHFQAFRDDISRALDKAVVERVGQTATNLSFTWPDQLFGPPMPYSKKEKPPELDLWRVASGGETARSDDKLKSFDKALAKTLNAKYAMHDARQKLANEGSRPSPKTVKEYRAALKNYHRELHRIEYVSVGYMKEGNLNANKVQHLRKKTVIERAAIEIELQIHGMTPEPRSSIKKSSLPFGKNLKEVDFV